MTLTIDQLLAYDIKTLTQNFLTVRNGLAAKKKAFEESVADATLLQENLRAALHKKLLDAGLDSARTDAGTPYLSTTMSAKVTAWDAFHAWVEEVQEPDFLVRNVASKKVEEWVDAGNPPPPGIEISYMTKCNVRSS